MAVAARISEHLESGDIGGAVAAALTQVKEQPTNTDARRMLIEHSVHACVQRILQSAPDAIKTVVYDGGDGATWSVQVPDGAIAEDWDEMGEDLEEMTTGQVLTDPYSLAPMCVGYNSATGGATGLVVNRHTGRLVEAEIDLAKLAGAKP